MMRRRGNGKCNACEKPIFPAESKWCERCSITLSLSLDATRTTMRSRKLKNKAAEADVVEVLSSDEERERERLKQIEDAEEISDEDESPDEEVPEDLRADDPRVAATEFEGVFRAEPDERGVHRSRTFARYRFRLKDFPIITPLDSACAVADPGAAASTPADSKKRAAGASAGSKKKAPAKKKAAPSAFYGDIDMYFLQNPDDYAASEYESSVGDDLDSDSCVDLTRSDGSATEDDDEEYRTKKKRRKTPVPDEPCFICESRDAPDGAKTSRVQCPDCEGVYHRSCADSYDGKQTGCLQCEDEDLIDDSELTETDLTTTSEVFGAFHIKDEPTQAATPAAEAVSPSRLDDEDDVDDMAETGAAPDVVPDASQVKQTILAGWKTFLDERTAAFDADFIAATRAIEAENGFKTTLEADLHKLFQYYTSEQARADELERKQQASPAKEPPAAVSSPPEPSSCDVAPDTSVQDDPGAAEEAAVEDVAPSIPDATTIDLTSDAEDDDVVVEVPPATASPMPARPSASPTKASPTKLAPVDVTTADPSQPGDPIMPSSESARTSHPLPAKKPKRRIALVTVPPPPAATPTQPKPRPQDPRRAIPAASLGP